MKRKGFTLIELLAVIVILAIIALITVPMIVGVIEKARKGAFLDSAYGILDSLKLEYINKTSNNETKTNSIYTFPNSGLKISGKEPGGGSANMDSNGKVELAIWDDDKKWCATKASNEETITIVDYTSDGCKITEPILMRLFMSRTLEILPVDIVRIEIVGTREIPDDAYASWDASEEGNGSVMAWVYKDTSDTSKYKLYLGGNGVVYAPRNSNFLFSGYSLYKNLKELKITNLNTSKVTSMGMMFSNNEKLTSLDVENFDTSNVTNMEKLFSNCENLTNVNVSHFDTSKVTDMNYMFLNCSGLTSLDLSNFDTSKVKNMASMFYGCGGLTSLNVSSFDTSNVTVMQEMFLGCSGLTSLDLSNFNTSKVKNMSSMFYGCSNLENLNLNNFDTTHIDQMYHLFFLCTSLTNLDISNFTFASVSIKTSIFQGLPKDALIKVKDQTAQEWILALTDPHRPSAWTVSNVVIG